MQSFLHHILVCESGAHISHRAHWVHTPCRVPTWVELATAPLFCFAISSSNFALLVCFPATVLKSRHPSTPLIEETSRRRAKLCFEAIHLGDPGLVGIKANHLRGTGSLLLPFLAKLSVFNAIGSRRHSSAPELASYAGPVGNKHHLFKHSPPRAEVTWDHS